MTVSKGKMKQWLEVMEGEIIPFQGVLIRDAWDIAYI
eukprot:SAG31_NODE_6958_length_1834_cov_0.927378_1_plen_37_part_00